MTHTSRKSCSGNDLACNRPANGQTLGKKALGIRIADMEGRNPGLAKIFLARMLPVSLVGFIPMIGNFLPLVDVLFIFNHERRCVHDFIAGTQVLKA